MCTFEGIKAQTPLSSDNNATKIDTLALIGSKPITTADFLNRFELSIYPGKDDPTMLEKVKRDFLYSMIAEKLLSQAAEQSEISSTSSENLVRDQMEKIFMRDALYKKEIIPRAQTVVTNDEILKGFSLSVHKYLVDAYYFESDSAKAWDFWSALREAPSQDIYKLVSRFKIRHDTLEIPYGESSANLEGAFFGQKEGYISKPIMTVDGVLIFKVLGREPNQKFISGSTEDRLLRIRKILVARKEMELGNEYVEDIMKNVRVTVDYKIFRPLVYAIQRISEKQNPLSFDPRYRLSPQEILLLQDEFKKELSNPLLTFNGGNITLKKVFEELASSIFATEDTTISGITFALHNSLRFISQNYFLVKRARELGLENSPGVKYNIQMVLDAFRSYRMANQIIDNVTITQSEADIFFAAHHDEVLKGIDLRLRVYETENINQAFEIYTRLTREKDSSVAESDTTVCWVKAYDLGEIGAVLAGFKRGEVYGPVVNNGKFFLYQIFDKKSSVNNAAIKNSVQVAEEILLTDKKREVLCRYIAKLAKENNVRLFSHNVLGIRVTPFQMLTYRYMGFGGRILAVPALYPREEWIKYFYQQEKRSQP